MLSKRGGLANYFKLAYEYFRIPRWSPLDMAYENKSLIAFISPTFFTGWTC